MPEQLDDFDRSLRDRIGAAEARVRVSSTAPAGGAAAPGPSRWLRPVLVAATAAVAVVLAVLVIGQLPDRSVGDATPSPSAGEGVSASVRNGDFVLTLSSPRFMWSTEDAIEITATLSHDLDERGLAIGAGAGPIVFSLVQLEGGNAVLAGGQDLPCLRYPIGPDAPLVRPYEKSGGVNDEPPFDRAFFEDPELHLPPGRWEIRAFLEYGVGDCGSERLEVAIQLGVMEAADPPGPSAVATEPPGTSTPTPNEPIASASPFDDNPASLTGVLSGDRELEGGCVWLRDASGANWEVIWPDGYRDAFRDGVPVLLHDGEVVATEGDVITVRGERPTGLGSWCMVGILYEASSILIR